MEFAFSTIYIGENLLIIATKPNREVREGIDLILPCDLVFCLTFVFDTMSLEENLTILYLKAVCVEAGMIALRREAELVTHEDFMDAVMEVQAKKKQNLNYYA